MNPRVIAYNISGYRDFVHSLPTTDDRGSFLRGWDRFVRATRRYGTVSPGIGMKWRAIREGEEVSSLIKLGWEVEGGWAASLERTPEQAKLGSTIDEDFFFVWEKFHQAKLLYVDICSPKKCSAGWFKEMAQVSRDSGGWSLATSNVGEIQVVFHAGDIYLFSELNDVLTHEQSVESVVAQCARRLIN